MSTMNGVFSVSRWCLGGGVEDESGGCVDTGEAVAAAATQVSPETLFVIATVRFLSRHDVSFFVIF